MTGATPIRVLIAEDEVHLGTILQQFLSGRGCDVTLVRDGAAALDRLLADAFDVALLDIVMPEMDGLEVLRRIRETPQPPEVIIITGNGSVETAISALKLGAYDYLAKPYRMAEIEGLVRRAWEKRQLTREHARLVAERAAAQPAGPALSTQHAPLAAVLRLIERVASSDASMLITGPPGSGKARLARFAHWHAERSAGASAVLPFAACDCARLSGDALEAELFGTTQPVGGGTRVARVPGLLELLAGGSLHLARVELAPLSVQQRLADALATRQLRPARDGEGTALPLSTRVLATSSADVPALVAAGRVDRALYDVLTAVRVQLPPLRERLVDLPLLARELLDDVATGRAPRLTDTALDRLAAYAWPGNVRELRTVLERAALLARGGEIDADDLWLERGDGGRDGVLLSPADATAVLRDAEGTPLTLEAIERQQIMAVLAATDWHQGAAAAQLGVSPKTLYRKIREYGLARPGDLPARGRRPTRRAGTTPEGASA